LGAKFKKLEIFGDPKKKKNWSGVMTLIRKIEINIQRIDDK
jgi:hypothetical protein